MNKTYKYLVVILVLIGCGKDKTTTSADSTELGQQVGNTMAGLDETGGSAGALALFRESKKVFARHGYEDRSLLSWIPQAHASSCSLASTFGSCTAGTNDTLTRTFGGCTLGTLTFDGSVDFIWSDNDGNCYMENDTDSVQRKPNWTMTGRRGATLTVTSLGNTNQVVTRTSAGVFSLTNADGIQRKFAANNITLFDFTTKITSAMTVTGGSRSGRTLSGGNLEITNNLTGKICNLVPTDVTWDNTCNCATSGTWSGSCTTADSISVAIQGCGSAKVTVGDDTSNITFDRCYEL